VYKNNSISRLAALFFWVAKDGVRMTLAQAMLAGKTGLLARYDQWCIIVKKEMMRLVVFLMLVWCIGCSSGHTNKKGGAIDTAKLFDPIPDTNFVTPLDWFKNAVAFKADYYIVSANDVQKQAGPVKDLCGFIHQYAGEIRKQKFYLLCDSSVAFSRVVATIDCLAANSITNYKVVNTDTILNMPPAIHIQSPVYSSKKYVENDSASFVVSILPQGMEVKHMGQRMKAASVNALDKLLQQYQQPVDSSKVFIMAKGSTNINRLMPVLKLLRKRGFSGIRMVTAD
jgi:biopolymer transport protein ExbD